MKKQHLTLVVITMLALFSISAALETLWTGDDIIGNWYTAENKTVVKIYKNKSDYYFGKITWLKNPNEDDGKAKVDKENPDPKLRNTPLLGMLILKSFKFDGDKWAGGTIYDPENGKTYKCTMKLTDNNTLDVRGYIGVSAIGRTTTWKRKTD
ncbi:MAG: DUF2147 domain-containing protein [Bacteroidales bacterium]